MAYLLFLANYTLFTHFIGNKLFPPSQAAFLPDDSCIAQLLVIIHEIPTNFDSNTPVDVRGVFLHISKAFDKVWNKGLLFKFKSYGVEDELLSLLECYFCNREQRVVLNGQTSDWGKINSGVPQGSFLIYTNYLPDRVSSICKIFADDTLLFSKIIDTRNS